MRAICKKCGYQFDSMIIDKHIAFKEIMEKSGRHIQQKHAEMFKQMQDLMPKIINSVISGTHFAEFMFVPEDEEALNEMVDGMKVVVMTALGFEEPLDDEEDEQEGDGDENQEGHESDETVEQEVTNVTEITS